MARVHHQTRRTLAMAGAFALAAPVSAAVPHDTGAWLPLHLFLVGGLLGAIAAATVMLAVTWSSAPAPAPRVATAQRWSLGLGVVAVVLGREEAVAALAVGGALAVALSLELLASSLAGIRREAVVERFHPAIEAYLAAVAFGLVGVGVGIGLDRGWGGSAWVDLREAHLVLNLYGLVGLVVAGTLPFFTATQARTKMSARADARRVRTVVGVLVVATVAAAAGQAAGLRALAGLGLLLYAAGVVAVAALVPAVRRRQFDWAGPRLVQLGLGVGWWVVATVLLAVAAAAEPGSGPDRHRVVVALVVGGFAQILVSAVAYLGPVLRGGGHELLGRGFALTRSWPAVVGLNVAAVAALAGSNAVVGAGVALTAADVAVRAVRFALDRPRREGGARA